MTVAALPPPVRPARPFATFASHRPERDRQRPPESRRVPNQVVALIRDSQQTSVETDLAQAHTLDPLGSEALPLLGWRMQVYHIPDTRSIEQVTAALQADPRVLSVQPNFLYRHQGESVAKADDEPAAPQYDHEKLQLAPAHALARGRGVIVAVIDSVIDASHPGLQGAVVDSYDAVGGPRYEKDTHGTAVAGLIRGRGAASGVAPEAQLLAIRAFRAGQTTQEPEATTEAVIKGVHWALVHGANVLNMSFTGPEDPALRKALAEARSRGAIAVAAAGNGGPFAEPCYPAAYPEVIAVTAVDSEDHVYADANRGHYIAVAAPGVSLLSALNGGGYELFTGTSFAAAEVSGVVALLLERRSGLDPASAEEVLARSSETLGPDAAGAARAGRVNALASLKALER